MRLDREFNCPCFHDHTPCPVDRSDYIGWHAWARKIGKTHKQIRCSGCDLYTIWVPKKAPQVTNGQLGGE